jgi:hypothetical protein
MLLRESYLSSEDLDDLSGGLDMSIRTQSGVVINGLLLNKLN